MLKIRRVMIIVLIIVAGVSFVMQKDDMTVRALTAENVTIIEASQQSEAMEHEAFIAEEYVSVLPEGINLALEAKIEVEFDQTTAQYIRLAFSSNTGAGGGQLAEFEVYGE